ncbi:hypothetical protein HELRODRAFT_172885 [Helobdella robusta]|uniref:Uncharacterized protein n=1 Tax=Helobdella robusta TaxID=6412 RepID=T1F625_HELRO|nr:hypothetical protein HELRODRAFT_172885 [Helobdella robusta]ESO03861.1 hypothetical protein HELRODRAFT_172885 [Helobdella robusta]
MHQSNSVEPSKLQLAFSNAACCCGLSLNDALRTLVWSLSLKTDQTSHYNCTVVQVEFSLSRTLVCKLHAIFKLNFPLTKSDVASPLQEARTLAFLERHRDRVTAFFCASKREYATADGLLELTGPEQSEMYYNTMTAFRNKRQDTMTRHMAVEKRTHAPK